MSCNGESTLYAKNNHTARIAATIKAAKTDPKLLNVVPELPVKGDPPVICGPGAAVVADPPTRVAPVISEATGGAGVTAVELAGIAALTEEGLKVGIEERLEGGLEGTGSITTVDAAVAVTVVLALGGPTMMTDGSDAVLWTRVMKTVVVDVDVVNVVCSGLATVVVGAALFRVSMIVLCTVEVKVVVRTVVIDVVVPAAP